ncbi:hypothetical protein lerEdw1_006174 [Lerista edwardsae]|nr:hypothetical protein lerEdw1_006174 [Lerista edwardsae]
MTTEEPNTTDYDNYLDFLNQLEPLCTKDDVRTFTKIFLPFAYSLICILGLVGNMFVVMTFALYKKSETMTDICLFNMAILDILFVLTLPFWTVNYALDKWIFGNVMCKLTKGIYAINFNCGMLLLTCISLDRYVAIGRATKSFRLRARTLEYRKSICLIVWALSVLISTPTFIFNESYIHSVNKTNICEHKSRTDSNVKGKVLMLILQVLAGFFIPLLFMIFCYTFIVKTLVQAQNSKRNKAIRLIACIVIVFLICQVPYSIVIFQRVISMGKEHNCQRDKEMTYVKYITETLAFLHCCMNPVLYAFIGVKFRNHFVKLIKDLCCVGHKKRGTTPSSRVSSDTGHSKQTSEICE